MSEILYNGIEIFSVCLIRRRDNVSEGGAGYGIGGEDP